MDTEGHERGWREGHKKERKPEMDLELIDIREIMD
jgi:hypothetical protein